MRIMFDIYPAVLRGLQLAATPELRAADGFTDEFLASLDPYARVISHGRMIDRARVVIMSNPDRVMVAVDSPEGVKLVFDTEYVQLFLHPVSPRLNPVGVLTADGRFLVLQRDTGCGCGSRLRGWNPFRFTNSDKDANADA